MGSGLWLLSNPFAFADRRRQALFSWVRACGSCLTLLLTHRRATTVVTVNQGALVGRSAREGAHGGAATRRGVSRAHNYMREPHAQRRPRTRTPHRAPRPCARSGLGTDTGTRVVRCGRSSISHRDACARLTSGALVFIASHSQGTQCTPICDIPATLYDARWREAAQPSPLL